MTTSKEYGHKLFCLSYQDTYTIVGGAPRFDDSADWEPADDEYPFVEDERFVEARRDEILDAEYSDAEATRFRTEMWMKVPIKGPEKGRGETVFFVQCDDADELGTYDTKEQLLDALVRFANRSVLVTAIERYDLVHTYCAQTHIRSKDPEVLAGTKDVMEG